MKDVLTTELVEVLNDSVNSASLRGDSWVHLEHIVLALFRKYGSSRPTDVECKGLYDQLQSLNLKAILDDLDRSLRNKTLNCQDPKVPKEDLLLDPEASRIFKHTRVTPFSRVGTSQFLESVLVCDDTTVSRILKGYGITPVIDTVDSIFSELLSMFNNKGTLKMKRLEQPSSMFGIPRDPDELSETDKLRQDSEVDPEMPFLSKFGYDMVKSAFEGRYDPMIGREAELSELMEILACRKKNNALLLGDPGTGKTSIVEGLAQRISEGNVPRDLMNKRLFCLDLNSLVAGTKYRGQYEERLQGVIKDVVGHKEVIVYIDEFHNLIGNGSSSGSGDGANILKPYLARGEFQCIGATTSSEYKKMVEKDGALKRRFQNITVYQPSQDETLRILENIKEKYENFHGVSYSTEVLRECVSLSDRYITDRFFPDKAIDIMDMAGARTKLDSSGTSGVKEDQEKLEELMTLKKEAVKVQDFGKALQLREAEKALSQKIKDSLDNSKRRDPVTLERISKVIEKITGVPSSKISQSDMGRLKGMKKTLESKVIGQPEAIRETVMALQRNSLGLRDPKRPIASLMMVGPTGSGKTYICKTIATEFFGTPDALIRFDMSEFSEKHEITKLLGSTASYVGYDDEPLFEKVRNRPHCVVLFDEIEKAAPEIYQVFLNILDEGEVTLGNGVKVNFKNSIIVFTGNIGTKDLERRHTGFGGQSQTQSDIEDVVKKSLKKTFSPEFINRLSKTIVFNRLTKEDLRSICTLEIQKLIDRLADQGYSLKVSEETITEIIDSIDTTYGARDLQRNIVRFIEEPVCDALLTEENRGTLLVKPGEVKVIKDEGTKEA